MEEGKKQQLLSLHKQLEEVRVEIWKVMAAIKDGLFLDEGQAAKQGSSLRELKRREKQISREIEQLARDEKA